mmetsp:Transcript_25314/g.35473  ORF Transcript_25314/g.35473 Transcript_25314/m.35473 type:complete len:375 (+) Transcript_25314:84-1208(+)
MQESLFFHNRTLHICLLFDSKISVQYFFQWFCSYRKHQKFLKMNASTKNTGYLKIRFLVLLFFAIIVALWICSVERGQVVQQFINSSCFIIGVERWRTLRRSWLSWFARFSWFSWFSALTLDFFGFFLRLLCFTFRTFGFGLSWWNISWLSVSWRLVFIVCIIGSFGSFSCRLCGIFFTWWSVLSSFFVGSSSLCLSLFLILEESSLLLLSAFFVVLLFSCFLWWNSSLFANLGKIFVIIGFSINFVILVLDSFFLLRFIFIKFLSFQEFKNILRRIVNFLSMVKSNSSFGLVVGGGGFLLLLFWLSLRCLLRSWCFIGFGLFALIFGLILLILLLVGFSLISLRFLFFCRLLKFAQQDKCNSNNKSKEEQCCR